MAVYVDELRAGSRPCPTGTRVMRLTHGQTSFNGLEVRSRFIDRTGRPRFYFRRYGKRVLLAVRPATTNWKEQQRDQAHKGRGQGDGLEIRVVRSRPDESPRLRRCLLRAHAG
jgi:hypothetical protein